MDIRSLVEVELTRRGADFSFDEESGRYELAIGGGKLMVSIERLIAEKADAAGVAAYFDVVYKAIAEREAPMAREHVYFELIAGNTLAEGVIRGQISEAVDWVLVHWNPAYNHWNWLTPNDAEKLGLTVDELRAVARANMGRALNEADVVLVEGAPFKLAYFESSLPFKSVLILAQELRAKVEDMLGWPLVAVAPCRDFAYLMGEADQDQVGRLAHIVIREFNESAYPLSTELFSINDEGVEAIGSFALPE